MQSYNKSKRKDQLSSNVSRVNYVGEISNIDGASFVPGILKGDNYQLNYQTTLTKPHQENQAHIVECYGKGY